MPCKINTKMVVSKLGFAPAILDAGRNGFRLFSPKPVSKPTAFWNNLNL
jgi:hypothetical protein